MFITSAEIDRRLRWKPGRSERLARRNRLPHYVLPDGQIRFIWDEIEPLIVHVQQDDASTVGGDSNG